MNGEYDLVLYGLGVMGENFIRNFARNGYRVIGVNRTVARTELFAKEVANEPIADRVGTAETLVEACRALKSPGGAVLAMIKANDPVVEPLGGIDELFFTGSQARIGETTRSVPPLADLVPPGTVIIDAANSHPSSTARRCAEFARRGILFVGTGVSGGAEGALKGPSIMPGGTREAYEVVGKMLETVSAQVDGPCCTYLGDNEAGHFVKNIHNGIEYGIMQAISEVFFGLQQSLGLSYPELHEIFAKLTAGAHGGYLMEISTAALGMVDAETQQPVLDVIVDRAGQKGTGKWTSQMAFDLGVPVPTIAAALQARIMSSFKPQREKAARRLKHFALSRVTPKKRDELIAAAADALYATMIAAYDQGFWMLQEGSKADPAESGGLFNFTLNMVEIARIWKGGCIIRSKLLDPIREAYLENPKLHSLMMAPYFKDVLVSAKFQKNWRRWVTTMVSLGLPVDSVAASLTYYDTYSTARLPANMIQAQRDTFGEHGFERVDKDGKGYHLNPAR
ncbi:MAG: NADP-dependent phosphogluconate dehydrogenase [Candidatus Brocadiaceae bacterium]|nr:NADP-dependent phosphogluconate dehydrogenase [Candidatus Brocadiaceae bacterium]